MNECKTINLVFASNSSAQKYILLSYFITRINLEKTFISVVKKNINMKDSLSSCTENIMANRLSCYLKVFITEMKFNLLNPALTTNINIDLILGIRL